MCTFFHEMAEVPDDELTALRADAERAGQLDGELASLRESAGRELRAAVLVAHPDLPEQLVVGSTAAELDASVASATALVEGIRERTLNELRGLPPVKPPMGFRPAGSEAGGRGGPPPPPEGARGIERIRWGLENGGAK